MINLIKETIEFLNENDKAVHEVLFVTDLKVSCSWSDFVKVAKDIKYDNGFGTQEINSNLYVVGKDWWLEREEYDGGESWSFKTKPEKSEFGIPCILP